MKICKNHEGDLSQKLAEPNMWFLVNQTKPTNTLYWDEYLLAGDNYKSTIEQLQNSRQLQSHNVKGAMSMTINRVIIKVILMAEV